MKRLILPVSVVAWVLGVWNYWCALVPSVPDATLTFDRLIQVGGATRRREYLILHEPVIRRDPRVEEYDGEIVFWKVPEGRITRRFQADGPIKGAYVIQGGEFIVIREQSRLRVIDAETLSDADELGPRIQWVQTLIPERGYAWYLDAEKRLKVRDVRNRRDVWEGPICDEALPASSHFIVAVIERGRSEGHRIPDRTEVLDAATGERVTRFDHLGVIRSIRTRANSPYAIVRVEPNSEEWICSVDSGEKLRKLTEHSVFSRDGQSIWLYETDGNGDPIFRRWSETEPCGPLPVESSLVSRSWGWSWPSGLVSEQIRGEWRAMSWLGRAGFFEFVGNWVDLSNWEPPRWRRSRIVDVAAGRFAVNLADSEMIHPIHPLQDESGVLIHGQNILSYYSNPARRNWAWLVGWSLVPPVIAMAVCAGWRRMRGRGGKAAADS